MPGIYHVEVTPPNGYYVSKKDQGEDDSEDSDLDPFLDVAKGTTPDETLVSGENNMTLDGGLFRPACLGDYVWNDANVNGVQEAGESPIEGVHTQIHYADGSDVTDVTGATVTFQDTDANGDYYYCNLIPGEYKVSFRADPDSNGVPYITTKANKGDDTKDSDIPESIRGGGESQAVTLTSGEDDRTIDAGFATVGNWSGNVTEDTDNDDTGDQPMKGVAVKLFSDPNCDGDRSDGAGVAQATTDQQGNYRFANIPAGCYVVVETQPSGYVDVSEKEGGDDNDAQGNTPTNEISGVIDVGETDSGNNFVEEDEQTAYRIGDLFWIDDGNGIYNEGEGLIDDALVELLDTHGNVIKTTHTKNGRYHFDVPKGKYRVRFHIPQDMLDEEYKFVSTTKSGDDTNKVLPNGVVEAAVEVGPGKATQDLTLDAAVECSCAGIDSDSVDALNVFGLLLMLMATLGFGFGFIRQEEKHRV